MVPQYESRLTRTAWPLANEAWKLYKVKSASWHPLVAYWILLAENSNF